MKIVNYLKSLMVVMLAFTVGSMAAANVDSRAAQAKAIQFMNSQAGTRYMASLANMKLAHAEKSAVKADANDYYVFNMEGGGYIIVSGDDRAEEILGYGSGHMDVNNLPSNVAWWLGHFKEQMEYLFANPKASVETHSMLMSTMLRASSVPALVPCTWDQEAPYYNQCPTYRNQHCLTGCVATAMAQVMYYWKYPASLPALDGYSQQANSSYGVPALTMEALPATTLEWDKMIDDYSSVNYTTEQGNAVAKLMRYCGQAVHMEYSPDGSGAYSDDQRDAMVLFGYSSDAEYVEKSNYNETQWHAMMQAELEAGRPIMYGGNDYSQGGHAFIVDGFNASTNKYHVNFGWSGYGDNYYALNAFSANGMTFNYYQDMIIKVYPESQLETYAPEMKDADNVGSTSFRAVWTDQTPSENVTDYTLYVDEYNPNVLFTETFAGITVENDGTANIANSLDQYCDNAGWTGAYVYQGAGGTVKMGSGSYAGNLTTPALDLSDSKGTVTVKFNARYYGSDNSSVVVSCGNVSQTVALTATAADYTVALAGVTAAAGQNVKFACTAKKKRVYIDNIEITPGSTMLRASETGDASHRVITGITSKNYTVNNLNEGGSYKFYVEANYTDGSKKQSNVKAVTLEGTAVPTPEMVVDAETVTLTTNVLETTTATIDVLASDLTGDVTVTLNDETGFFTVTPETISMADAQEGATITVTYAPTAAGEHSATVTLSSEGAQDVTVTINGTAAMDTLEPEMQPADEEYVTTTSFRADWIDVTPEEYVTSYTLYVNKKQELPAGEVLLTETFGGSEDAPEGDSNIDMGAGGTLDDFFDNAGWTGYGVYLAGGGGVKLGAGTKVGSLTTPALDLTNYGGTVTVKFSANSYGSDNSSVIVSCGEVADTIELDVNEAEYTVVLTGVPAEADQHVTLSGIANKKRFYLYSVTIIGGEETIKAVNETGDADSRVITGITDMYYVVENLTPGATYSYYVEANYIDGTKAGSNIETVTLLEEQGGDHLLGDVNHDGMFSIKDVTDLIDYLMNGGDICTECADFNGVDGVSVADATSMIDYLLTAN